MRFLFGVLSVFGLAIPASATNFSHVQQVQVVRQRIVVPYVQTVQVQAIAVQPVLQVQDHCVQQVQAVYAQPVVQAFAVQQIQVQHVQQVRVRNVVQVQQVRVQHVQRAGLFSRLMSRSVTRTRSVTRSR